MKPTTIQIYRPEAMLLGIALTLIASTGLAEPISKDHAAARDRGEPKHGNDCSGRVFDKSFESFAPAVERVAPAVVRIVTPSSADTWSDLSALQDPSQRSRLGRVLGGRSERPLEVGLGPG